MLGGGSSFVALAKTVLSTLNCHPMFSHSPHPVTACAYSAHSGTPCTLPVLCTHACICCSRQRHMLAMRLQHGEHFFLVIAKLPFITSRSLLGQRSANCTQRHNLSTLSHYICVRKPGNTMHACVCVCVCVHVCECIYMCGWVWPR